MKVGYNARYHWLKERVLLEYKTRSWVKAVTPSAKLYYVRTFSKLLSSFFSLLKMTFSEQASQEVATEKPNQGF